MMLMVFAGLAWVVSGYMSQSTVPQGQSGLDIDLTGLVPGDYMIVRSGQRKIIVWHRTDEMLAQLMNAEQHLQDPDSSKSQQPSAAANPYRSVDPQFLVVSARNDTQGCEVQVLADVDAQVAVTPWFGGFKNSCREIYYDLAGRSYKHREEPHNLDVPPHQVLAGKLYIMAED
jgi:ubiquinol-cytochrome c reductase iron-sulfur subunit